MVSAAELPGGSRVDLLVSKQKWLSAAVSARQDKPGEGQIGLKVNSYLGTWQRPLGRAVGHTVQAGMALSASHTFPRTECDACSHPWLHSGCCV